MKNINIKSFTLIEISIVLVIIGIILSSVMKGRDLIKSSQIKEYNQVFISEWETIANSYFSRMNVNFGDSVNYGGKTSETAIDGFSDGQDVPTTTTTMTTALQSAGIDPCNLIKSDITVATGIDIGCGDGGLNPYNRTVDGEHIGKKTTTITFSHYTIDSKKKNILLFSNIPADVAQSIDTLRDGMPNGEKGNVRAIVTLPSNPGDNFTSVAWDGDSTSVYNMIIILEH